MKGEKAMTSSGEPANSGALHLAIDLGAGGGRAILGRLTDDGLVLENVRFVTAGTAAELMQNEDIREFYLGIKSEVSAKGYQRYKRKKRWR